MRASVDTSAGEWLQARQQVQSLAEVILGESAEFFLYRGKLYQPQAHGQYIFALLGSVDGCEAKPQRTSKRKACGLPLPSCWHHSPASRQREVGGRRRLAARCADI